MTAKQMKLGDQIRRAVRASGLGNNELSRAVGIDKGAMSRFMAGKRGLSLEVLDRLAEVVKMDVVRRESASKPSGRSGRKAKSRERGKP